MYTPIKDERQTADPETCLSFPLELFNIRCHQLTAGSVRDFEVSSEQIAPPIPEENPPCLLPPPCLHHHPASAVIIIPGYYWADPYRFANGHGQGELYDQEFLHHHQVLVHAIDQG